MYDDKSREIYRQNLIRREELVVSPEKWYKRHGGTYKSIWKAFENWLASQGVTWQGFLRQDPAQIRNLVDDYLEEVKKRSTSRSMVTRNAIIRSFLLVNDIIIPRTRITLKGDKPATRSRLTPELIKEFILRTNNLRHSSFLLFKFQSVQDTTRMLWINKNSWSQIKPQLDEGGYRDRNGRLWKEIIRVDIECGRKLNDKSYFCFVGKDAIKLLRDYFNVEGWPDAGGPIWPRINSRETIVKIMIRQGEKLGLIPKNKKSFDVSVRYGYNAHEFRDVSKSLWHESGADLEVWEFVAGHTPDRMGYDKVYTLSPDYAVKEYRKALSYLNLVSGGGRVSSEQEEEFERRLGDLRRRNEAQAEKMEKLMKIVDGLIKDTKRRKDEG